MAGCAAAIASARGGGVKRQPATRAGDGTWRVDGLVVPLAGQWTAGLDILVSDFDMVKITAPVDIRP